MTLHWLEILPIAAYLVAILFLGFYRRDRSASEEDFIVGGRRLTLPAFIATLVTTWYGGILGVGEFTYLYGISNWVVFGLPYYVFAILFAFLLAGNVQRSSFVSIPDQFYCHYGRRGGILGAIFTFFMTLPAPYMLMVGLLFHLVSGWALWVCIILGALFSVIYVLSGGFHAVVRTDKLQFVLMFGGFAMLLAVLVWRFGGLSFLSVNLPAQHLTWHGGNSLTYISVWFFIALWTFIDPGFHQRCYAARTPATARNGILISVGFWLIFDCLTTASGLYARALLQGEQIRPALSFPLLGHEFLPPLLSGLFLTGLFATIMSTVDSYSLLSAITIGHDLLKKWPSGKSAGPAAIKTGLLITVVISIVLAIAVPSVIELWLLLGNIFIPPMLLPLLGCYFPALRPDTRWVLANLVLAFLVSLAFLTLSVWHSPSLRELSFYGGIPPMYPGLLVSLLIFGLARRKRRL